MCRCRHLRPRCSRKIVALLALAASVPAAAQTPGHAVGEVAGNDVYLRSGPSLNHYPVYKLNAGDRVAVVGEKPGWFEILPPEGTFSLISGDFVDTADDKVGVVNGDNVRVRAGSVLNDQKYTVQTKLSKGAQVAIMQRNPDGFLRIVPPEGVTLWVSSEYVARVPAARQAAGPPDHEATKVADTAQKDAPAATERQPDESVAESSASSTPRKWNDSDSLLTALTPTLERRELVRIDEAADAEFAKPLAERDFQPLIEQYKTIAEQEGDEFSQRYARARVQQLTNIAAISATVTKVRKLSEQTNARRREFMEERTTLSRAPAPSPAGLDAQGELRVSALYPPGSAPHRYRLVDISAAPERTIGYVDIPPDSGLSVDAFVGHFVGVRASRTRLQDGGVNPVPIYVARELVMLRPNESVANPEG